MSACTRKFLREALCRALPSCSPPAPPDRWSATCGAESSWRTWRGVPHRHARTLAAVQREAQAVDLHDVHWFCSKSEFWQKRMISFVLSSFHHRQKKALQPTIMDWRQEIRSFVLDKHHINPFWHTQVAIEFHSIVYKVAFENYKATLCTARQYGNVYVTFCFWQLLLLISRKTSRSCLPVKNYLQRVSQGDDICWLLCVLCYKNEKEPTLT